MIQQKRKTLWNAYYQGLQSVPSVTLPQLPEYATNNGHMFYVVLPSLSARTQLIRYLQEAGYHAVFHYISLHSSPYYQSKHDGRSLPHSDHFTDCLLRLPLFYSLSELDVQKIVETIRFIYEQ